MEIETQEKSIRKRRRGIDANNTPSEIVLSDDGNKHHSIRSRRTQIKPTIDSTLNTQSIVEKGVQSPESPTISVDTDQSAKNSTPASPQASPALQQATRELHARIMTRVRDLAPSFTPPTPNSSKSPAPTAPLPTPTSSAAPSNPSATPSATPSAVPSTTPSTSTPKTTTDSNAQNTTRTVKELQHLISQYVQQQRANLGIANPNSSPNPSINNTTTTSVGFKTVSNTPINTPRAPTDVLNDNTFQKSSIIANKFSNAITKYTTTNNSKTINPSNFPGSISNSHFPVSGGKSTNQMSAGHEGPIRRSVHSFHRPASSVLDKHVPALSIRFKHNKQEKRLKTEYGYYDDCSTNSDGNSNYFLLAAQHELQNMDEEMATQERLEGMENEIERLQRAITMRDRVIRKLHIEIQEKDSIIRALPYELVSNWVAASHMMMEQ